MTCQQDQRSARGYCPGAEEEAEADAERCIAFAGEDDAEAAGCTSTGEPLSLPHTGPPMDAAFGSTFVMAAALIAMWRRR